jgi:hypothetical protein
VIWKPAAPNNHRHSCKSKRMGRAAVVAGVLFAACIETNDAAFAPGSLVRGTNNAGQSSTAFLRVPKRRTLNACQIVMRAKKDEEEDEDDDEDSVVPGMADAFRQLGDLDSLGDGEDAETTLPASSKPIEKATFSSPDDPLPSVEPAPPEKEVQMYKAMVQDLEQQSEDDLYSNVLADMGGSSGAPKDEPASPITSVEVIQSEPTAGETEEFMNKALNEAMKEVKVNNPSIAASILDDKEIMKEIEVIFERGNEKLMASLEAIRQEQVRRQQLTTSKLF